ncbi:hypothetical protein IKN40_03565 [bacterium]|nr:hypothetical protein [bacterium]
MNEKSNGNFGNTIQVAAAFALIVHSSSKLTINLGDHAWLSIANFQIFNLIPHISINISAVFVFLISADKASVKSLTPSLRMIGSRFQSASLALILDVLIL